MFVGLGLQDQLYGYAVRNIFEGSFTEEVKGAGNAIFRERFKFSASEIIKKLDSIDSAFNI